MKNAKFKLYFGKALKTLSVLGLSATLLSSFAGCKDGSETLSLDDIKATFPLLNQEKIITELEEQYGEDHGLFNGEDFYRLPMTVEDEATLVNVNFETNENQKEVVDFCINEINDIFKFVNKKYKFETNYSPSKDDLNNPYAINLSVGDSLQSPITYQLKDLSQEIDGNEIYNTTILLQEGSLNSELELSKQLKVAFAKILGLEEKENSVITSKTSTSFTKNDITVLYSLYRSPENVYDLEGLKNYITDHTVFGYETLVADKMLNLLSQNQEFLPNQFALNYDYRLNELEDISKAVVNGENDKEFGTSEINFVNKVKNPSYYKPYNHMSIKDGQYTQTNFMLDDKFQPFTVEQDTKDVAHNNGVVVIRDEDSILTSLKVGNYIVEINSTLKENISIDELLQNAQATVYSVTNQDYQTYSQALSNECNQKYSPSQE